MQIYVEIYANRQQFMTCGDPIRSYFMDHSDPAQRRVLGEQCRNAFEGGQLVVTGPVPE